MRQEMVTTTKGKEDEQLVRIADGTKAVERAWG